MVEDEKRIVERVCGGEMSAFDELVQLYQRKIYRLSYDLTGNQRDAEDISQMVFVKAFQSLKSFRGESKVSSWLYRIAVNTCIDLRRKYSVPVKELSENEVSDNPTQNAFAYNPERATEARMIQVHVDQAIQKVPLRQRTVFVLRHYDGLSLNEIAEILNISISTAKGLLFRAIKRLRKELSFYRPDLGLEDSE